MALISLDLHYITLFWQLKFWAGFYELLGWKSSIQSGNTGRCWSRDQGFPGKAVHKAELRSQTLLYQSLHARWKENDIQHFLKTVGFLQKYKNTRTGFRFWNVQCSTKHSPHPPTIQISVGGIYLNDILMSRFVISQTTENNDVVRCSSWKGIFKKRDICLWSGLWDL